MIRTIIIFSLLFFSFAAFSQKVNKAETKAYGTNFESEDFGFAGFRLEPPYDLFSGRSKRIQSEFVYSSNNLQKDPQLSIRINVDQLKTGIAMVDKYFKEVFMHTQLFPEVVFTLDSIRNLSYPSFTQSDLITAIFHGKLYYHGVTRDVAIPVTLKNIPAKEKKDKEYVQILTEFEVNLSDYNVQVPENLKNRIGENATLFISLNCEEKLF